MASGGRLDVGRTMAALPADLSVFKSNPNARLPYDASRAANALGFDPSVDPAVIDYQPTNPGGRLCLCRGAMIAGWHNLCTPFVNHSKGVWLCPLRVVINTCK